MNAKKHALGDPLALYKGPARRTFEASQSQLNQVTALINKYKTRRFLSHCLFTTMSAYKNIALVGVWTPSLMFYLSFKQTLTDNQAAGNVGQAILNALLASPANFNITLLVRAESTSAIPQSSNSAIKILKGDFNNQVFLKSSLTGQDALIFALNSTPSSFELQNTLSDVAAKAGVKRIIPSDFGSVSIHIQLSFRTKTDR